MVRIDDAFWRRHLRFSVCAAVLCFGLCEANSGSASSPPDPRAAADFIVNVKRIWTGDRANPWAEAVAARGGSIVAVGRAADVMRFRGPSTRMIARPDAFAMPGLVDAHGHMESLGASQEELDIRGVASVDEASFSSMHRLCGGRTSSVSSRSE
jgi:hypothetical protein